MRKKNRGIILLLCAVLFGGCAQTTSVQETESTVSAEAVQVDAEEIIEEMISIEEIYTQIQQSVSLVEPMVMSDDFITNYYGIDIGIFDEYLFSMSESATSAETIILTKVKDIADIAIVQEALQVIIEEKKAEMENYLPQQYDIVNSSTIEIKDSYIWVVISASEDSITSIITNAIS